MKKKGLQPLPYKFPFEIKKTHNTCHTEKWVYRFFINKKMFYNYYPDSENVMYLGNVERMYNVKTLKQAEQIIYNHYKNLTNENKRK